MAHHPMQLPRCTFACCVAVVLMAVALGCWGLACEIWVPALVVRPASFLTLAPAASSSNAALQHVSQQRQWGALASGQGDTQAAMLAQALKVQLDVFT